MIFVYVLAWVVLGILGSGLMYAYWRGKYPQEYFDPAEDWWYSFLFALIGPFNLVTALIFLIMKLGIKNMFQYGIKFRGK